MRPKGRQGSHLERLLASQGLARTIVKIQPGCVIFSQGDAAHDVMYVLKGYIKDSTFSKTRREAVLAIFGPGDFFGEACLTESVRKKTAIAITPCTLLVLNKTAVERLLHTSRAMVDRFVSHLVGRKTRVEADLLDQLVSPAEQRLARALLLLPPRSQLSTVSQATLAAMVGTTRSRINMLLRKFESLGFIDLDGGLTVKSSLLKVVLHDKGDVRLAWLANRSVLGIAPASTLSCRGHDHRDAPRS